MRCDRLPHRLAHAAALIGFAAAPVALAARAPRAGVLSLPICGDPAHRARLPIDRDRPGNDCSAGCHAMCLRRAIDDEGDRDG